MKLLSTLLLLLSAMVSPVLAFDEPDPVEEPTTILYGRTNIGKVQLGFFADGMTAGRMWPSNEDPSPTLNWGTYHFVDLPFYGKGLLVVTDSFFMWGTAHTTPQGMKYFGLWSCGSGDVGHFKLTGC